MEAEPGEPLSWGLNRILLPDTAWRFQFKDTQVETRRGTLGSIHITSPGLPVSELADDYTWSAEQTQSVDVTMVPVPAALVAANKLLQLLRALPTAAERRSASLLTITSMLGLLAASAPVLKVLKKSRHGFARLPLFPLLVFLHDALHATLNCGKRMFNGAFRYAKALDVDNAGLGVEKEIAKKLSAESVHSGHPTTDQGTPVQGDFVAWVVKQLRGAQFNAALRAKVWEAFSHAGYVQLADAFELVVGLMYMLHKAFEMGLKRATVYFFGRSSDEGVMKERTASTKVLVKRGWQALRETMCRLFPVCTYVHCVPAIASASSSLSSMLRMRWHNDCRVHPL